MTTHHLKSTKPVFRLLADKLKTAEVRLDDRLYQTGDTLIIYEGTDWDRQPDGTLKPGLRPATTSIEQPDRKVVIAKVLSIINGGQFGIKEGHVLMSLSDVLVTAYYDLNLIKIESDK